MSAESPEPQPVAPEWDPWEAEVGQASGDPNRTLGDWLEAVIPAEAQVHFANAGKEFALGVQTTVAHHLGRRALDGAPASTQRIEIE